MLIHQCFFAHPCFREVGDLPGCENTLFDDNPTMFCGHNIRPIPNVQIAMFKFHENGPQVSLPHVDMEVHDKGC